MDIDPAVRPGTSVRRGAPLCAASGSRLLMSLWLLLATLLPAFAVNAQAWLLTETERKNYLKHYAPVIMQRAEEDSGKRGRDWISNYDFDRDGNFANNRYSWPNLLPQYVAGSTTGSGAYQHWRIRPTLYASVIEFMDGGSKALVLLYHVYHPVDKKANEIHDWERIEIVVRGVTGIPGDAGEYVGHVTITSHKDHVMRSHGSPDLNFMQVASGKHVMIWQADEDNTELGTHGHELHFVQDSYATISARVAASNSAEVEVTNDDDKSVHYVWVPETSAAAVSAWKAKAINYVNAATLAAGRDDTVLWSQVKRITYELQDMADVFAGQWSGANWSLNWTADVVVDIQLDTALLDEAGAVQVPAGRQRFYLGSRDTSSSSQTDGREGVLAKKWFWGGYSAETNADTISGSDDFEAYSGAGRGSDYYNRADASGDYASLSAYWRQHDFFVHAGGIDTREYYEVGHWLRSGWQQWQNGGYDGRWAQLFDDRFAVLPLALALQGKLYGCGQVVTVTAQVGGGESPLEKRWGNVLSQSADGLSAQVASGATASLAVTSADGQNAFASYYNTPYCRPDPGGNH